MHRQNIGFVSTRFAGTDGVSLEAAKWAQVLWDHQYFSYWFAGQLDRAGDISMEVPEAFFGHPENESINQAVFGRLRRTRTVTNQINSMARHLKAALYRFVNQFGIDILVVENALCMPMHIPLGVAITHFIAETEFPVIGHHHDFYWERDRFSVNAVNDFLQMAFPPALPSIQHVTINTAARDDLAFRKGCSSQLIPNVLDFENQPPAMDEYAADFRDRIGLAPDDIMVLQPTRVVPRKGIEKAIGLLASLRDARTKLVVSHESGDEGPEYLASLQELAHASGVDLLFVHTHIGDKRGEDRHGHKRYSLWDVYPHADLVTYPSVYEGFGNALLEAFYFRKPVVVNRYSNYIKDIEPRGFRVIAMDGLPTDRIRDQVERVIEDRAYHDEMVDHNYEVAKSFFSYTVLRRSLRELVCRFTGADDL